MSSSFLQLRHLRYFLGVVDAGSFCRAAATIRVAQPALSQQLAAVEAEFGVALLQRSSRGVRLTREGEIFYREAASILQQVDQLHGIVRSTATEPEGLVRLGMSSALVVSWACEFMEACRTMLPKVDVRLVTGDDLRMRSLIASRALDIALVLEDEPIQGMTRQPLFHQPLSLVRPPVADIVAPSISLEAVANVPLVLPARPNTLRSVLDRAFQAAGVIGNCIAEVDTFVSALSLVKAEIANAVVPRCVVSGTPAYGDLRPIVIDPPIYVTGCLISSGDTPLACTAQAVGTLLATHVENRLSGMSPVA